MSFREVSPAWRLPLLPMATASLLAGVLGGLPSVVRGAVQRKHAA